MEKMMMAFRQYNKFVADLDLGCCSLGAEGSNIYTQSLKSTLCFFIVDQTRNGLGQYRMVAHDKSRVIPASYLCVFAVLSTLDIIPKSVELLAN